MKKKNRAGVVRWSVLTVICAVLMVGLIVGNVVANYYQKVINIYLNTSNYKIVEGEDSGEDAVRFVSDYDTEDDLTAAEKQLCAQLEEEGAVLLTNDGALPLAADASVSLFSHSSVDIVYGGTGSGNMDTSLAPTLREAIESVGMSVNGDLWDFYESGDGSDYARVYPDWYSSEANGYAANEVPWSVYPDSLKETFSSYGDAAIVTLSRIGGEDYDVNVTTDGSDYLSLSTEEAEMLTELKALKDEGVFRCIVVLLNTSNALECDFLYDEAYGVDAALWIGGAGQEGLYGVANILCGNVSPSGHLADTFLMENDANPALVNFGGVLYTNLADTGLPTDMGSDWSVKIDYISGGYTVYQEGIYLGYRYYETRYEDTVMGTGNTEGYVYTDDVAFPFGYGLSYTDFAWSDFSVTESDDAFTVTVTVTNTGDVAGKDVVEIYLQSPYTDYDVSTGIEKASAELCGFTKTDELAAGESQTVTVTVDKSELTSYDSYGYKTYILEDGDYYLTAASDSHEAVNNILAAKGYTAADGMTADGNADLAYLWTNDTLDATTYSVSGTGYEITNRFDDADINLNDEVDATVTYMSRSDWNGTYPTETYALAANDYIVSGNLSYYDMTTDTEGELPTMGADNGMTLAMMIGLDYDDESWEDLLDQLSFDEMANTIAIAYHGLAAMPSVSMPATLEENGPQGFTQTLSGGGSGMAYTSEDVMAATWNVELMNEVGKCIGEDCLSAGDSGIYGPGVNMHRTAYSGRNFEYYAEDPFLAGAICTTETEGIQSKGVYVYLKHFAMNDQETNRSSVNVWANEQTIREIYLKPFEMAVTDGGAMGVMSAYNFMGTTWCGANYNLLTEVLRNEWGAQGIIITDYGSYSYQDAKEALLAGTNCWDTPESFYYDDLVNLYSNDPSVVNAMRESAHRILYSVANSNALNGMSSNTTVQKVLTWWQMALYAVLAVFVVLTILCVIKLVLVIRKSKAPKAQA